MREFSPEPYRRFLDLTSVPGIDLTDIEFNEDGGGIQRFAKTMTR